MNDIEVITMLGKRFAHIDFLEALAIFLVILYHTPLYSYNFLASDESVLYVRYFLRCALSICVPTFFFANGYLLLGKPYDKMKHRKKILHLFLITLVWIVITAAVFQLIRGDRTFILNPQNLLRHWIGNNINHTWYMAVLLVIYILFPLIKRIYDNKSSLFIKLILILSIFTIGAKTMNLAVVSLRYILSDSDAAVSFLEKIAPIFPTRERFAYAIVYFGMGGIAYKYRDALLRIPSAVRITLASLTIALSLSAHFFVGVTVSRASGVIWDVVWSGYDTPFTALTLFSVFLLSLSVSRQRRILTEISKNTLGIYFVHRVLTSLAAGYLVRYEWMRNVPMNVLAAACILAISYAIAKLLSHIPLISRLVK